MCFKNQFLAISILALFALNVFGRKFNVSLSDMDKCEEYTIKNKGYTYADFFHINSMKNNGVKNNERLHLKFYVMTTMDAHILLSESNNPTKFDRVYEIVFGAGGNSFSAIRTMLSRQRVATALAQDLLSVYEPMPVEIVQYDDGLLVVNIPGFSEPHLNYTDTSPLNISYVSFSSYGQISAKWFYDCQFDGFFGEMEMETRPLSNSERLAADILNMSDPDLPPPGLAGVTFSFKVRSVEFDQKSSILSSRMHIIMDWQDNRLVWDPSDYGGIEHIAQPLLNLWHPVLTIVDGALDTFKGFKPFFSIRVNSNGTVSMISRNAELQTWCFEQSPDWPNDDTVCDIVLEATDKQIKLIYDTSSPLTDQSINELSEWRIDKVTVRYDTYEREGTDDDISNLTKAYLQSIEDDLKIQLTISRNSAFYHSVFTAPVYVTETLILLAFFLEEHRRGGMNLVALVVLSIAFMFVAKHAPPLIVPDIITAYTILMKISTLSYILHILSMWLEMFPPKFQPHRYAMTIINCSALRFMLAMKYQDSAAYLAAQEYPWQEISKILNRLFFVAILITFICINCII